jgi:Big-like domain-containing protein
MATTTALRPRLLPAAAVAVALFGCDSTDQPTAPDSAPPAYAISDAAHEGMPHFFLLPPLVDAPRAQGTFDATLAPTVEICALRSSACGEIIASFTKEAGPGGEVITVDPEQEQYQVEWKTREFALSDAINYRIVVRVGAVLLGYVDVDVARNASQFKNLNTNEVIGLVDGRTLPIKFRPERGIPGRLGASPAEARVGVGDQRQLHAVVYDLHDEIVAETFRVRWTSSDTDVASVDENGVLLAKASGRLTVGLSLGTLKAIVALVEASPAGSPS